jgi:hypothetical protein
MSATVCSATADGEYAGTRTNREPEPLRRAKVNVVESRAAQRDQPDTTGRERLEHRCIDPVVHKCTNRIVSARERRCRSVEVWLVVMHLVPTGIHAVE